MSVLQQCNEESARIFAPMARRIARERKISLPKKPVQKISKTENEKTFKVLLDNLPENDSPAFSQDEDFHFLRVRCFIMMVEEFNEGGKWLQPDDFDACFDVE